MRSRPSSRIVSSEAPGWEWESASRAAASFSRSRRETVMLTRARSPSRGRTFGRSCAGAKGRSEEGRRRSRDGRSDFGRPKYTARDTTRNHLDRRARDRSDEKLPNGRVQYRPDRRGDERRVSRRLAEEPGKDLGCVLRREHLGDLDDRGEAEVPAPERRLDLGVPLDELRGRLLILGRARGEPKLPRQEGEQRRIPQLHPPALAVEGREGDEKLGEGVVLAAEKLGEADRVFACRGHERILARVSERSVNARDAPLARKRDRSTAPLARAAGAASVSADASGGPSEHDALRRDVIHR
jgi:hypothetical protein